MFGLFHKMSTSAGAIAARLAPRQFFKREEGTITAFAVMMFVLMVGVSGIAIDVMRYETQRTQLQYTLDRAVLAAASLTQPYDPEGVVRDYFSIAGIEDYRLDVRVDEGINFRRVHAYAELEVRSLFMQLFGVRVMTSPAIGAAEERVRNIEISMVLDISGSMGNDNRMTNMRPAAREFVTEVLTANDNVNNENLVSVSIVPYNGRVNGGAMIESVFTFDSVHSRSNCARFSAADFQTTAIDPAVPIQRISHWDRDNEDDDQLFENPHCQTDEYGAILPWQHTESVLHAHIDALGTGGWTAIDLGMNWAVALLDPAAAPAVQDLIAANQVHADFIDRPAPFNDDDPNTIADAETIKVVVLMTDGDNTNQYDLRDPYRTGYSPIFFYEGDANTNSDDRFSVWWQDQGQFWIPTGDPRDANGYWSEAPFPNWEAFGLVDDEGDGYGMFDNDGMLADDWPTLRQNTYVADVDVDQDMFPDLTPFVTDGETTDLEGWPLPWTYLWANYTAEYIAEEWLEEPARASGEWSFHDDVADDASYLYAGGNQADTNLRAICDAANANGIVVFAIGFEAPTRGQEVMRYCASSDANYYDVQGIEITEAFASIARTINQLRLIQ